MSVPGATSWHLPTLTFNASTSGLNTFYVTENNGQTSTIGVVIGSNNIQVAVTLSQSATIVTSVNNRKGDVTLTKTDVGLDQVNDKPTIPR